MKGVASKRAKIRNSQHHFVGLVEKADTSIFRSKSGHVGPEFCLPIKKDQFDKCIIEETISENTYK